jgi:hypothetical protein
MKEISGEHKTTTILPVPINLFAALINLPTPIVCDFEHSATVCLQPVVSFPNAPLLFVQRHRSLSLRLF